MAKGEMVRSFILNHIEEHPADISSFTAHHFDISRQGVNKHLQKLVAQHQLEETGATRNKLYHLAVISEWKKSYKIDQSLAEDLVWRNDISKILRDLPENVINIWHYGFTEMFNNAIDHSETQNISVKIKKTAISTEIHISDNGIGIFKKIQSKLNLLDERHALFELVKGKLTTDPRNHTGEGIFFTSRAVDSYSISSGSTYFSHKYNHPEDWILEKEEFIKGTEIGMKLNNASSRILKTIFDQYATEDEDYGFNKTVVPVNLAKYGDDKLISRSQAKRLVARFELFKRVILDFAKIDSIGQAFADEIFRVFANQHPEIELSWTNASAAVKQMIERARAAS